MNVLTWLYNCFIQVYVLGIRIASNWNKKAREWINGRKSVFEDLEAGILPGEKTIWFHCASAGELEQGKPLIEAVKKEYPSYKIVISFFSPSGFHAGKKYAIADVITYLPADTKENAKRFINLVHPELVVFIKYEFWYHHLSTLAFHHIPVLLVSSIFRKDQAFFKWYGRFYRQILFLFRQIFVQDNSSLDLLKEHQVSHCIIGGDTRFDRVIKIASNFEPIELIKQFAGDHKMIVAGSTWPDDEKLLADYAKTTDVKFIIAPHEINHPHIASIQSMFSDSVLYSSLNDSDVLHQVLIIDNIGLLSRLYHYADITYIGGGFNKSGIHNTLEAAIYGKPVIFGPHFQKFKEARDLVDEGAAFSINNAEELKIKTDHLLNDPFLMDRSGNQAKIYVLENTGATQKILDYIQANRLLTR